METKTKLKNMEEETLITPLMDLTIKQAVAFTILLGEINVHLKMGIPLSNLQMVKKFRELDKDGLLPESCKETLMDMEASNG